MAEWMTGVMMIDQLVMEIFMSAMETMGNPAGKDGPTVISMPTEVNAAVQAETETPNTGATTTISPPRAYGGGGRGDYYPI